MTTFPSDALCDYLCDHVSDYSFSDGEERIPVEEAVSTWLQDYVSEHDIDIEDTDTWDYIEVELVSSCGRAAIVGGAEICQGVRCWRE